jgi:hypothetical protein
VKNNFAPIPSVVAGALRVVAHDTWASICVYSVMTRSAALPGFVLALAVGLHCLQWQGRASAYSSSEHIEPDGVSPLLQDRSARTTFISRAYNTCLNTLGAMPENAPISTPELGQYCLCYGRALADAINEQEYQDLAASGMEHAQPSVVPKATAAANMCHRQMRVDEQSSARENDMVEVTRDCLKTYYPDDTDYQAAVIRDHYCTCLASEWVDLIASDRRLGNTSQSGSGGAASRAIKRVATLCSALP